MLSLKVRVLCRVYTRFMYVDGNVDERCMERDFLESGARAPRTRSEHNNYLKQAGGLRFSFSLFLPFGRDEKYSVHAHSSEP